MQKMWIRYGSGSLAWMFSSNTAASHTQMLCGGGVFEYSPIFYSQNADVYGCKTTLASVCLTFGIVFISWFRRFCIFMLIARRGKRRKLPSWYGLNRVRSQQLDQSLKSGPKCVNTELALRNLHRCIDFEVMCYFTMWILYFTHSLFLFDEGMYPYVILRKVKERFSCGIAIIMPQQIAIDSQISMSSICSNLKPGSRVLCQNDEGIWERGKVVEIHEGNDENELPLTVLVDGHSQPREIRLEQIIPEYSDGIAFSWLRLTMIMVFLLAENLNEGSAEELDERRNESDDCDLDFVPHAAWSLPVSQVGTDFGVWESHTKVRKASFYLVRP